MSSITNSGNQSNPAVIFARVSTHAQSETSLPSQVGRCQELLERESYSVIEILQADWSSMDLWACPEFQQLLRMVRSRQVRAVCVFDRDRLQANGLQRLVFLDELKECDVRLLVVQGPAMLEGSEGQIVELALALGKEKQVLRARQGSRDGLHDRVTRFHKPVTRHKLYGYQWETDGNTYRLKHDDHWANLRVIFDMLLAGSGYQAIINELSRRGIPSPSGQPVWNKTTLSAIVWNPAYAGKYYGLKKKAVEPRKRRAKTTGNSSNRRLLLSESHYMPEIQIESPPISWDERERIITQLAVHQKLAQRHAKNDYLLRGVIFCGTHRGINGKSRGFRGRPKGDSYAYVCPVGGCSNSYLKGPTIENEVKAALIASLFDPENEKNIMRRQFDPEARESRRGNLGNKLKTLETQERQTVNKLAKLLDDKYSGKVADDVYERLRAQYEAQRLAHKDETDKTLDELAQIGRERAVYDGLKQVSDSLAGSLGKLQDVADNLQTMTNAEWRDLFARVNLTIRTRSADEMAAWKDTPPADDVDWDMPRYEIRLGIPVDDPIWDKAIASGKPGQAEHNKHYYSIEISAAVTEKAAGFNAAFSASRLADKDGALVSTEYSTT